MHPEWYYNLYDEIFGWSRNYLKEITMINDIIAFPNKVIEEIGAGTGRHTEQILQMNPLKVNAIDWDSQAIRMLRKKFKQTHNLQIIEGDGFARKNNVDIIICLYSILQQTEKKIILEQRITNLINRIEMCNCHIFVECIDTQKHNKQELTTIYETKQEYLGIRSEKTDFGVKIIYQGHINKLDVSYEVPICNCPLYLFEGNSNVQYEIIPLSQSGRKRMLHIYKR